MIDRIFIALQYLLPKRALGRLVYGLARSRIRWIKNSLISGFVRVFPVDLTEMAVSDPCSYASFNEFFARELKPGARPVDPDTQTICGPADGSVQQIGQIASGQLLQAKGMNYALDRLLDTDPAEAERFNGGQFLTIYLAPHNYHRVHAPSAGHVRRMHFIPGELFSVNATTARHIPGLFARNERVAFHCEDRGLEYWLVFVGAMNVASVSTAWSGEITAERSPRQTLYSAEEAYALGRGDYCGHFNMGSTVIVIYPPDTVTWDRNLKPGDTVRANQVVGRL